MEDKIYLQFYEVQAGELDPDVHLVMCHNGFSRVWDLVNPIWVGPLRKASGVPPALPKLAKEIYVSCFFPYHIYNVYRWAKQYPECQFYIGGPAYWPHSDYEILDRPTNLHFIAGYVEDLIGVDFDPYRWKIVPPEYKNDAATKTVLAYSNCVGTYCYWNRCKFCVSWGHDQPKRKYVFETLNYGPPGLVWLATPSILPWQIKLLPSISTKDKSYVAYARGTPEELKALKEVTDKIDTSHFTLSIGVEFPSNRMLRYMDKGVTVESLLDLITFGLLHNYHLSLQFMFDWPTLTHDDVEEARGFMDGIPRGPGRLTARSNRLVILPSSTFGSEYRGERIVNRDAIFHGYWPKLPEEDKKANDEWFDLLTACGIKNTTFGRDTLTVYNDSDAMANWQALPAMDGGNKDE